MKGRTTQKTGKRGKSRKAEREEMWEKLPKNANAASKTSLDGKNGYFSGKNGHSLPPSFGAPGELATTTNLSRRQKPNRRKDRRKEERQKIRIQTSRKEGRKGRIKRQNEKAGQRR